MEWNFPSSTQNINLLKKHWGNLHGIPQDCTYFVGSNKVNNRLDRYWISHTYLQTAVIPPWSWNACDYVLQSIFKKAHNEGSISTAADFVFRLELKVIERIKLREDIQTTPNEGILCSSDIANENSSSTRKQKTKMRLKNRPWKGKNNFERMQHIG